MFKNCPLLALIATVDKSIKVCLIVEDEETKNEICKAFSDSTQIMLKDKSAIPFDGRYSPNEDDDEYLSIDNFELPEEIIKAVRNPLGLDVYTPCDGQLPPIKALLMGEEISEDNFTIVFQKFKNDQYISQTKHHLLFSNDTFKKNTQLGISISNHIDCVFQNGKLKFTSYFFARQIFDLSRYYCEATTQEVQDFVLSDKVVMANWQTFVEQANSWERRKIASIMASGVLLKFTVSQIKKIAKNEGIDLTVDNKKIVLPQDKGKRKLVLGFLDEEVYKGAFTDIIYQTNSKRKAE